MTSPKSTVLDALGTASGLGRPAVDSILGEVRANLAKLDACPGHEFVGVPEGAMRCKDGFVYRKFRCVHCEGTVDSHAEHWYRRGIEHAKGGAQ